LKMLSSPASGDRKFWYVPMMYFYMRYHLLDANLKRSNAGDTVSDS
jgi:hypothetical protein